MSEVDVVPAELDRFAHRSMNRHADFDDLHRRMPELYLSRDSFGYVPGLGHRVHQAYDEFVAACTDSLASAAEFMSSVSVAVTQAARAYAESDQAAHGRMSHLQRAL